MRTSGRSGQRASSHSTPPQFEIVLKARAAARQSSRLDAQIRVGGDAGASEEVATCLGDRFQVGVREGIGVPLAQGRTIVLNYSGSPSRLTSIVDAAAIQLPPGGINDRDFGRHRDTGLFHERLLVVALPRQRVTELRDVFPNHRLGVRRCRRRCTQ